MIGFFGKEFEYFLPSSLNPFEGHYYKSKYKFFKSEIWFYEHNFLWYPFQNYQIKISTHGETDLWYRLLVLHVYHAGAGNVAKALNII